MLALPIAFVIATSSSVNNNIHFASSDKGVDLDSTRDDQSDKTTSSAADVLEEITPDSRILDEENSQPPLENHEEERDRDDDEREVKHEDRDEEEEDDNEEEFDLDDMFDGLL